MVSPTLAFTSAGVNTSLSIVTWIVSARAETDKSPDTTKTIRPIHLGAIAMNLCLPLVRRDMFGMLLVTLENFQASLQQALELVEPLLEAANPPGLVRDSALLTRHPNSNPGNENHRATRSRVRRGAEVGC